MPREFIQKSLRQSDEFVGFFTNKIYQFQNRKKEIILTIVGLLVLAGAGFFAGSIANKRHQEAADQFSQVLESFPEKFEQDATNWQKFLDEMNTYLGKYGNSALAGSAYLYKAKAEFSLAKYSESLLSFQKASDKLKTPYQYLAQEGQAISHMELDQLDQAQTIWAALAEKKDNPLRDFHLYNLALIQEKKGQTNEAKATYSRILAEFPESPYAETARMKSPPATAK